MKPFETEEEIKAYIDKLNKEGVKPVSFPSCGIRIPPFKTHWGEVMDIYEPKSLIVEQAERDFEKWPEEAKDKPFNQGDYVFIMF